MQVLEEEQVLEVAQQAFKELEEEQVLELSNKWNTRFNM